MKENGKIDMEKERVIHYSIDKAKEVDYFHKKFLVKRRDLISLIPEEEWRLRAKLIQEELNEYIEANEKGDIVEIADAIADLDFLVNGAYSIHGLIDKHEEIFKEVMRSNMSKLDKDGKPILRADGKIIKSELYEGPHIENVLFKKD
jgi:predicted HAD superfamily Cof-like phosphohydrolase